MQALKKVGHRKYMGTMSADGYPGSPTFVPPDTEPPHEYPAYGWYPLASEVPLGNDDYTQRVISSIAVGVPDATLYAPGDLVILGGEDFVVSQDIRDYTTGPWGPGPGGLIIVERVTG
jgi:hypothetical protein